MCLENGLRLQRRKIKRGQQKKSSLSDILVPSIQHEFLLVHEDILFAEPLRHRRKNNVLVTAEPRERLMMRKKHFTIEVNFVPKFCYLQLKLGIKELIKIK